MEIKLTRKAKGKLKKLGVALLYFIGSRATNTARANSDFDFAVVIKDEQILQKRRLKLYSELYEILTDATPRIKTNLPYPNNMIDIDIIFLQTVPLYYSKEAIRHGKILFAISPTFQANFEEKTIIEYADIEPILRHHDEAILQRI